MWYHHRIPKSERFGLLIKWLFKTVLGAAVTTLAAAGTVAVLAYIGWQSAPPGVKHSIEVLVSVDAEGLTQAIKDLQEWAAIEVEKARSN